MAIMFFFITFCSPDDIIQNGRRDIEKSCGTSGVECVWQKWTQAPLVGGIAELIDAHSHDVWSGGNWNIVD